MNSDSRKAKKIKKILCACGLGFEADRPIISDINWEVYQGERWILIGANGAGKTSLLSTLCAYNTPSFGSMSVDGKEYSTYNWQKMRERIALVGSHLRRGINRDEKAIEVVISGKFGQINYWGALPRRLIMEAYSKMKRLGIGNLVDSSWNTISEGERQKVLLARALMTKPAVIFLDEPCSGLDPVARKAFVSFLEKLCSDKKIPAIVMATHYVEEIPRGFTHALILKGGRVLASGKIEDTLNSRNLSQAYNAKCALSGKPGKYILKIGKFPIK